MAELPAKRWLQHGGGIYLTTIVHVDREIKSVYNCILMSLPF